jgi:lipopolysaccharide export system protein LptC
MTVQADLTRESRRAFAAPGAALDRRVQQLARWLPLAVGVLLGVMVITPLAPRGEVSFLLDRNKVAMTEQRLTLAGATYRGEDDLGRAFSVSAGSAIQHSAHQPVVELHELVARLQMNDGPASVSAQRGDYDIRTERMVVSGPVRFNIGSGYRLDAGGVAIDLKSRQASGDGGISGAIPAGTFSADRVSADLGARVLRLEGHARLRMVPGQLRMPK